MLSSRINCYHYCFFCGTDLCLDFLSTPGFPHTGISPLPGGLRFPDSAGAFHYEESAKLQSITSNRFIHWWETNTQTQMSDVTLIVVFKDWTFQQLSNLFYVLSLLWQTVNLLNCLVKFVLIFMICWGLCLVPETPRRCFKKNVFEKCSGLTQGLLHSSGPLQGTPCSYLNSLWTWTCSTMLSESASPTAPFCLAAWPSTRPWTMWSSSSAPIAASTGWCCLIPHACTAV